MFAWHDVAEPFLIPTQLCIIMLGMGAALDLRDFARIGRQPGSLLLALSLHWLVVPGLALTLSRLLRLGEGWSVGLLLIATAPGAGFANLFTFIGRGHLALAISGTGMTTAACVLTTPLLCSVLAAAQLPADFHFPVARVMREILAFLLLPLSVGLAIRRLRPRLAAQVSRWCIRAAIVLLVVLTVGALGSGRIRIEAYGLAPPLTIVAFGTLLATMTPLLARALRRSRADMVALTTQVTMRNMGVALLMVRFFFPGRPEQGQVLYSVLFYAGACMWFVLPMVLLSRARGVDS